MRFMTIVALGALVVAAPSVSAESYPDTEYVSGKAGFPNKVKGTLAIQDNELSFQNKNGGVVFSIPMASVTDASEAREHNGGSFGRKMALGVFASKNEEFLTVKTQSADTAEAVVFKCKKKTSADMAAKISFYAQRLKAASATSQP